MIRRHAGGLFHLITQHDHALLSGKLAAHFGNPRFAPPEPRDQTVAAASLHDAGWTLHDDQPTLDDNRLPLDVFQTPLELALRVWRASADRAAQQPDYTQLLVSLHVLTLSSLTVSHPHARRELFELNKFQQYEIERQQTLRSRLGLPTDAPLRLGLAQGDCPLEEQQLRRNHYLIQFFDRISLALCCTDNPSPTCDGIVPGPGRLPATLRLTRKADWLVAVEPWPFDQPRLSFALPCRSLPAQPFDSQDPFRHLYAHTPTHEIEITVQTA